MWGWGGGVGGCGGGGGCGGCGGVFIREMRPSREEGVKGSLEKLR